jgi:hypothetical protein
MELNGNDHDELLSHTATPFAPLAGASDIRFVNLDFSNQLGATWPDHRLAKLVQHRPGSLLAPESQHALKTKYTDPEFLVGGVPGSGKPYWQRCSRLVQDGACRDRCAATTLPALPQMI